MLDDEVDERLAPLTDRKLPIGEVFRNRIHRSLPRARRRPPQSGRAGRGRLPFGARSSERRDYCSAACTAGSPSLPSKVLTPWSHGFTASGLALSQARAVALGSAPSLSTGAIIAPSMARLNLRFLRSWPRLGHSWSRPARTLVWTFAAPNPESPMPSR